MDAHTIVRAFSLVARVGRLNPDAGEIGPGMLASLVQEARGIAQAVDTSSAPEVIVDHSGIVADGRLMRELCAISVHPDKLATMADIMDGLRDAHGYTAPTTVAQARAEIQSVIDQTNRIHPS